MSGIATGTALAIGLGTSAAVGATTSLVGASEQSSAANYAADLQAQEAANALAFQKQEFATQQANEAPWIQAGQGAITNLSNLLKPGGGLTQQWNQNFQPPTAAQAAAYPGEQFQLQQGEQAIQRSAAAQGGLLTGGTAKALNNYAQGVASTDYQNVYNNQFQNYQQNYNQFQQQQANIYNRLAGVAGSGQTSVNALGQVGQQAAGNVGNILLTTGAQQGADIQNAAYQTASGYVGAGNALSGAGTGLSLIPYLNSLNAGTNANASLNV